MRVALVYDRVNKWGGAERVLLSLHKIFPDAPLYTSVYDKKKAKWAKVFRVRTSFLQNFSFARSHTELIPFLMPFAFRSFNFDDFDLVISVTSESAKGIKTKPHTKHICYCLTPTRYLWSSYDEYFRNKYFRFFSKPLVYCLRKWDLSASSRPDYYIAISSEVKKRIKKYYKRDSVIIFPPLPKIKSSKRKNKGEYYLMVSRLSNFSYYKKVDLAIETFNKLGWRLKIVGSGPLKNTLKKKANKNIEFVGELTDQELAYYYENCKALVFPGFEDFGLVMAEAQSFGKPVIAYSKGGARDIVIDGKTGTLFNKQTASSFVEALKKSNDKSYNRAEIIANSKRFGHAKFEQEFKKFIKNI